MVRWDVVSGGVPPLVAEAWQAECDAYRQSWQYIEFNRGMSLAEFKDIYFWEYVHRLLGRVIGLAFALPLLWFWARRAIPAGYGWRLVGLLALGGLPGAIGWSMVAPGRTDLPGVRPLPPAVHPLPPLPLLRPLLFT